MFSLNRSKISTRFFEKREHAFISVPRSFVHKVRKMAVKHSLWAVEWILFHCWLKIIIHC